MSSIKVGKLLLTLPVNNQLGEGVQWHIESQSIWWTDIENSLLFQYCVNSKKTIKFQMPYRVGSFAFIENSPRLIIAFDRGIALYDLSSQSLQWLAQPEKHLASNRFNDGGVDRQGRFWAGTMVEDETRQEKLGSLYVCEGQKITKKLSELKISNSLCWSPNSLVMYHADSPSRNIYHYSFDPITGTISNRKLFARTKLGSLPDGATVDAIGGVWVAQWGGGSVIRYTPQGEVSLIHQLPVSQPTCIAIGGPNMDWLIVTSSKQSLCDEKIKSEPLAGYLFIYQLHGIKGITEPAYKLVS